MRSLVRAAALLLLAAACAAPAPRDARSEKLDRLFEGLAAARSEPEARRIEASIQEMWLNSGKPEIDAALAQAITEARDYDFETALAILDDLVRDHPAHAEAWNQRAAVRFFNGNLAGSLSDADKALALEPRHFGALAGRALILLQMGDRPRAMESLRRAVAIDPYLRERDLLGD